MSCENCGKPTAGHAVDVCLGSALAGLLIDRGLTEGEAFEALGWERVEEFWSMISPWLDDLATPFLNEKDNDAL